MNLDYNLQLAAMVLEAVVMGLLFYRRAWRTLPFFTFYTVWTFASDVIEFVIAHQFKSIYFNSYLVCQIIDFLLQFCVLVEVAWSVVRPFRASLPRNTVLFLGLLVAVAAGVIWMFSDSPTYVNTPAPWHFLFRLKTTEAILRILFFLLLAGSSHFLSIGWRDRELQVITGLGFYSFAALTISILQSHQSVGDHYRRLEQFSDVAYLGSLLYWIFSFAQQEAKRREFTPQMQGMMLAVAGAARGTRMAITHSRTDKTGNGGQS